LAHRGEPQVVHQLEFGKGASTPAERARALARAAGQVAGYYQPFDLKEQGEFLPVILTGHDSEAKPVAATLQGMLQCQVQPPRPPLRYPQDFPLEEYATSVGLFLADQTSRKDQRQASGQNAHALNLLPERHRPRRLPVLQAAVFIILLLLAIHPFNVSDLVDAKLREKQAISRDLQELKQREQSHDRLLASRQESKNVLENTTGQAQKLESRLGTLQEEMEILLARLITMTSLALPPNVELSAVAPLGDGYSLVGSASSYAEALQYVTNLKTYPVFGDAKVLRVEGSGGTNPEGGEGRVSFQVKVSLPKEPDPE
jgi:Tfp pilus assembly protein PilN